jgi:hypothetical protein
MDHGRKADLFSTVAGAPPQRNQIGSFTHNESDDQKACRYSQYTLLLEFPRR